MLRIGGSKFGFSPINLLSCLLFLIFKGSVPARAKLAFMIVSQASPCITFPSDDCSVKLPLEGK